MNDLYSCSFDHDKRTRAERVAQLASHAADDPTLDPTTRALLQDAHHVATDALLLHGETRDLQILYNTVVEHATGAETELLRRNEEVSQFLAGMSHELRTPLSAIIGYCEMVLEIAREDGLHQILDEVGRIAAAGRHMLALTTDVLDLSKIEAGRLEILVEEVDVPELVEGVVSPMQSLAINGGNELVIEMAPDVRLIDTDAVRLRQCLTNLIGNACKFTKNGRIRVVVSQTDDAMEFRVIDTGIGMSVAQQARLFNVFAQATSTTSRDYGGSGLGLALSRRLTEAMGGTIGVQSERGKGSEFTMKLPRSTTIS